MAIEPRLKVSAMIGLLGLMLFVLRGKFDDHSHVLSKWSMHVVL